jgi:hypothetical protein
MNFDCRTLLSPSRREHSGILSCAVFAVALLERCQSVRVLHDIAEQPWRSKLTGQTDKYQPIHHQHGPKDRKIKNLKPTRHKAPNDHPRRAVPELEFRQPPDKRSKFLILLRWKRASLPIGSTVFEPLILRQRWVEFRLQEGEEEVQ